MNRMIKALAVFLPSREMCTDNAALAVSGGVLLGLPAAARADGDQLCESGEVCLSDGTGLSGNKYTTPSSQIGLDGIVYDGTSIYVMNKASSIQNRGTVSYRVLVYANTGYSGNVNCYQSGQISNGLPHLARGNLANNDDGSVRWLSGGSC